MRYNPYPRGFQTTHWRALYESPILDLSTLIKSSANGAAFVIIDAEPWGTDESKPAEIGMSLLPSIVSDGVDMSALLKTLEAASRANGLRTHWIRVLGRERREKNRERHRFGEQHYVEGDEVEQRPLDILDQFVANHGAPLILTGFHLVFEFRILSSLYPRLLPYFTSWLDLQAIARDMEGGLSPPGLRETLIACGFGGDERNLQSVSSPHNAATDTVRAATLLLQFLARP